MMPLALFGSLGMPEILLILLIVVFLFGARRIPEIARGLGEGIRGFRTSLKGSDEPEVGAGDRSEDTADKTQR
jgi:sec-independent protein translocase protein TatA